MALKPCAWRYLSQAVSRSGGSLPDGAGAAEVAEAAGAGLALRSPVSLCSRGSPRGAATAGLAAVAAGAADLAAWRALSSNCPAAASSAWRSRACWAGSRKVLPASWVARSLESSCASGARRAASAMPSRDAVMRWCCCTTGSAPWAAALPSRHAAGALRPSWRSRPSATASTPAMPTRSCDRGGVSASAGLRCEPAGDRSGARPGGHP
jgi:hypothetical protein